MRRFFVSHNSICNQEAVLSQDESRHITAVLRKQPGDLVELFDENGTVYAGTITTSSPHAVTVRVLSSRQDEKPSGPHIFLFQGMLKGKKMDFLIQKCTELGVYSFYPVLTRFSENRGNFERQIRRWQKIMLQSCKQCKRSTPMNIHSPDPLTDVDFSPFPVKLLLWENESTCSLPMHNVSENDLICLLLGPEGGFHQDEIFWAQKQGMQTVSLGPNILRAETASLSVVAIIQYLAGFLKPLP